MDSDEDVLFENSALHHHLQDVGMENLLTETHHSSKLNEASKIAPEPKVETLNLISKWNQFCSECIQMFYLRFVLRSLETEANKKVFQELRSCKTLEPDDVHFLEEFVRPSVVKKSKKSSHLLGLVSLGILLLSLILQRVLTTSKSWHKLFFSDPMVVLATCCIILLIGCLLFLTVKKRKLEEQVVIFIDFVKSLENYQQYLKKSIRLIQECELVARGFTFVANAGPLAGLEQNAQKQTARQCPELRHKLFHSARQSMMRFRAVNQTLLQKFYPNSPGEGVSHYLAFIPLQEYGPCLQISGNSPEELNSLLEATDNFSIASLKAIVNLWSLQQSEFVRCLATSFQSISQYSSNKSQTISVQRILRQIVTPSMYDLEESSKSLRQCYNFHYSGTIDREAREPLVTTLAESPLKGLYVAVHSLDLHLQSALRLSRNLATEIENKMAEQQVKPCMEFAENWQGKMEQVKAELNACNDCWSEGQVQSDRLLKKNVQKATETQDVSAPILAEPKPIIKITQAPIIEDEVFEAFVDEDFDEHEESSWDEFLSPEERAKKKREKEEARRLLSELKSVISGLAEERKKKEENILKAKLGTQQEKSTKVTPLVPPTSSKNSVTSPADLKTTIDFKENISSSLKESSEKNSDISHATEDLRTAKSDFKVGILPPFGEVSLDDKKADVHKQGYKMDPPLAVSNISSINLEPFDMNDEETKTGVSGTPLDLGQRLERFSGANLSFTASLAAQAVAKSRLIGLQAETFGSDDDDDVNDLNKDDFNGDDSDEKNLTPS